MLAQIPKQVGRRIQMLKAAITVRTVMPERRHPEIMHLAELAGAAADCTPDVPGHLAVLIKAAGVTDPYVIMGLLIEGIAHTWASCIPAEQQEVVEKALTRMLLDRFRANQAHPPVVSE